MHSYLNFIHQVLGIENILSPVELSIPQTTALIQNFDLLFVNLIKDSKDSLQISENAELFEKIKLAMSLGAWRCYEIDFVLDKVDNLPKDSKWIASEIFKTIQARYVILMRRDPINKGEIKIQGPSLWMETFSPACLRENPSLKKSAWNDLQNIVKRMN